MRISSALIVSLLRNSLLVVLVSFHILPASAGLPETYYVKNYNSKNGLTQNNVYSLFMDRENFLWASFDDGLVRFDGKTFKRYFESETSYGIFQICKTFGNEMILLDADGGIYGIKNMREDTLRKAVLNTNNTFPMKCIFPSKDFYKELSTPEISKKINQSWAIQPVEVFALSATEYFVRVIGGIDYYKGNALVSKINLSEFQPQLFFGIRNKYYFISASNKFYQIDSFKSKVIECKLNGPLKSLLEIVKKSDDLINIYWNYNNSDPCIRVRNTLYSLATNSENDTEINSEFLTDQIDDENAVTCLVYSKKNHLIAYGTDSKGMFILKENSFKTLLFENPEPGSTNAYYSQIEVDSNTVYTDWNREFSLSQVKKSRWNIKRESEENIFKDSKGFLWYRQRNNLVKYNTKTNQETFIYNLHNEIPIAYYEEGDSILVGTAAGINYVKNDTLKPLVSIKNGENNSNQTQLFRWIDNKIWFCNFTGVYSLNEKTKTLDTLKALYLKFPYNISFYKDIMIIGTNGGGVYFHIAKKTVHMPVDKGGGLKQVHAVIVDKNENAWLSSNKGVYRVALSNLLAYFKDTTEQVNYEYFGEENGINVVELNGGAYPSFLVLKNGYVSLPSMNGLVWFNPEQVFQMQDSSAVYFDAVLVNEKPVNFQSNLSLHSDVESIQIDFCSPFWGNLENVHMDYKLVGYTKNWIPIDKLQRSVIFSNLPSGNYTFMVRKLSNLKLNKYTYQELKINVEKKFYETIWFLILCLLTLIISTIAIAKWYALTIKKRNILLEKNVKQRTFELMKANEQLSESVSVKDKLIAIISHDILTPLRFIQMVAGNGAVNADILEKEKIEEALYDIKNISGRLYDNAQNILNWIKYQNNRIVLTKSNLALGVLVEEIISMFNEIAVQRGTKLINNVSFDDILKIDKNILSIILHNIISNSVKFTKKGTICVASEIINQTCVIIIEDTGKGMNAEILNRIQKISQKQAVTSINPSSGETGNGLGYIIITDLLELINGTFSIESAVGKGTKVVIHLNSIS